MKSQIIIIIAAIFADLTSFFCFMKYKEEPERRSICRTLPVLIGLTSFIYVLLSGDIPNAFYNKMPMLFIVMSFGLFLYFYMKKIEKDEAKKS